MKKLLFIVYILFFYTYTFAADTTSKNIAPIIMYLLGDNTIAPSPINSSSIIIDHKTDRLGSIPARWIDEAKRKLHVAYQGNSHSRQMTRGMERLMDLKPTSLKGYQGDIYNISLDGTPRSGFLDIHEKFAQQNITWTVDLSNEPNFDNLTIQYLDNTNNADINVVMWMWCWQREEYNNGDRAGELVVNIDRYIQKMEKLISMYGENGSKIKDGTRTIPVTFVFTTGPNKADDLRFAENENRWVFDANNKIRDHVKKNGRVLFDFYDLESYDPNDKYFGDGDINLPNVYDNYTHTHDLGDDASYKKADGTRANWAKDYQRLYIENVDWFKYDPRKAPEHTSSVSGNLKTYAMWWLFARLAGWDGK